jgi:tRNA (guanine6-N2)-methyltransferase
MPSRSPTTSYLAHTMPGLESVAWDEIRQRVPDAELQGFKSVRRRNGMVLFGTSADVEEILALRTLEDLFYCALRQRVDWGLAGLSQIYESVLRSQWPPRVQGSSDALTRISRLRQASFRVIVRISGSKQPYRRLDLAQSIEKAIQKHTRGKWRATPSRAMESREQVELWANLLGQEFVLGIRLSDDSLRQRDYKQVHLPASLRPSVAAAMAWLSELGPNDVFMDPMCGAGTILIERALAGRYRLLIGGELDAEALGAAQANIGPRHKPLQLLRWDATCLPLAPASVDKIATNLPFGKQIGSASLIPGLYRAFFGACARVLRPGGACVVLSNQERLVRSLVDDMPTLALRRRHPVEVLGQAAAIFVIMRTNRPPRQP